MFSLPKDTSVIADDTGASHMELPTQPKEIRSSVKTSVGIQSRVRQITPMGSAPPCCSDLGEIERAERNLKALRE